MDVPPEGRTGIGSPSAPRLSPLPIDEMVPAVVAAVRAHGAAVISAPPGAGKTTRVPPALVAAGLAGEGRLVMLEPRRLAARAAARRIAEERGWRVGEEVGYQVRFERRAGPATRILVVTEGILVQMLQADPFLDGIGAIVFDELHERSLATDLSLAMARRVQREVRRDLRLVAMSATLDTAAVAAFLGSCPVVASQGRLHPVEVRYLEPGRRGAPLAGRVAGTGRIGEAAGIGRIEGSGGSGGSGEIGRIAATGRAGRSAGAAGAAGPPLSALLVAAARQALAESAAGDVLVFLPGVGEIQRAIAALSPLAAEHDLALVPLYGDLPPERQDAALRPGSRRKVVLATNVAETSVTVEGVSAVVDSGLARRLRYDPATGLDRLELGRISRAAAEQRAGRAGRQGPGLCLRLWGSWEHASRPEREVPEIARVDLAAPALQLLAWGERDLAAFGWFEAPEGAALAAATRLLRRLRAVDEQGVTPDGRIMARLPVHPRIARLLLAGHRLGQPRDAALLAALLAERDPFPRPSIASGAEGAPATSNSDLLDRLDELARHDRTARSSGAAPSAHLASQPGRERGAAAARLASSARSPSGEAGGESGAASGAVPGSVRFVLRARDQLAELARRELGAAGPAGEKARRRGENQTASQSPEQARDDALLRALLAAYPDRLARRREPGSPRAVMVGGRGVRLAETSAVRTAELFVAVELGGGGRGAGGHGGSGGGSSGGGRGGTGGGAGRGGASGSGPGPAAEDRVRLASAVEQEWLDPAGLTTTVELAFDEGRERVAAWRRTRWEDLVIAESEVPAPAGPAAEDLLVAAAALHPERALPLADPEVASWLARVRCLAAWMPELGLPDLGPAGAAERKDRGSREGSERAERGNSKEDSVGSDPDAGGSEQADVGAGGEQAAAGAGLASTLRRLLPALAAGRRSFAELRRAPLLPALQGLLTPRQAAALAREAPERLAVPSGSQIRLRYEPGQPPVLAARIQALFGLAETPRVAAGRIPVLLHLLAPNQRPQQVTQDLRSFWQTTYPQVKKELAARYPKHSWPDDPWNAVPIRGTRPRRS
jgi:ATP-dependent helicase HrpB